MATTVAEIWICTDCMQLLANDEPIQSKAHLEAYIKGCAKVLECLNGASGAIVPGGSHDDNCTNLDGSGDCDCAFTVFSSQQCEICRSYLAGERFTATILKN